MTSRIARADAPHDEGFTLVELVVSAMLTVLVVLVVGGILISTTSTQGMVSTVTTATTTGQLVMNSIQTGIRNSEAPSNAAAPFSLTTQNGTDQLLIALVVGSGATATAVCQAWYYSSANKTIRTKSSSSNIVVPTASALATWTLLANGVTPKSGTTVFSTISATRLGIAFKVAAGKDPAVVFSSSISSRTALTGSATCY